MAVWQIPGTDLQLVNVHPETPDCADGCMIHHPTAGDIANVEHWPYHWRDDKGVMERKCPHGIGHPDIDDANYQNRNFREHLNIHGCDGCCRN